MMDNYLGLKIGKEIESIELNIFAKEVSLSKAEILNLSDELDEDQVDTILTKLEWRASLYTSPIFSVENNRVTPFTSWRDVPEYFLCLYYSYFGANDNSGGTSLFEKISAQSLKNFLGGEIVELGFPVGTNLNESLDQITEACNEERGRPAHSDYKDDGVDVVGYKSFGDGKSSNLYVLMQCAAGIHWTQKKSIPIDRWVQYIFWINKNIVESISTVDFVEKRDWEKRATTYGMLIDRLRIYNFLYISDVDQDLRDNTIAWCETKIAEGL